MSKDVLTIAGKHLPRGGVANLRNACKHYYNKTLDLIPIKCLQRLRTLLPLPPCIQLVEGSNALAILKKTKEMANHHCLNALRQFNIPQEKSFIDYIQRLFDFHTLIKEIVERATSEQLDFTNEVDEITDLLLDDDGGSILNPEKPTIFYILSTYILKHLLYDEPSEIILKNSQELLMLNRDYRKQLKEFYSDTENSLQSPREVLLILQYIYARYIDEVSLREKFSERTRKMLSLADDKLKGFRINYPSKYLPTSITLINYINALYLKPPISS